MADATGGDAIELAPNWQHLTDSHADIPCGQEPGQPAKAISFYKRAEAFMEGNDNSNERVLLEYGHGRVLLGMVRCADQSVNKVAKDRFASAQAIARLQEPELNEMIPRTLMHLLLIANLIEERNELWRDIDRHERSRRDAGATEYDQNPMAPEGAMLFERLLDLCQRIAQVREGEYMSL